MHVILNAAFLPSKSAVLENFKTFSNIICFTIVFHKFVLCCVLMHKDHVLDGIFIPYNFVRLLPCCVHSITSYYQSAWRELDSSSSC